MNDSANLHPELSEILAAMRDGELTDAQSQRLEQLLTDQPELQKQYIDHVNLCVSLRDYHLAEAGDDTEPVATLAAASGGGAGGWGRFLLAACILFAAAIGMSILIKNGQAPEQTSAAGVAVLTAAADARWASDSLLKPAAGSAIPAGKLKLQSGLVQIEFYNGATVILEGPAEFDLVAVDRGHIHQGRIRAHVPPAAQGFVIGSASMEVVDLGTEFGLNVDETGKPEIHVFDGKVELHDKSALGNSTPPITTVTGGKALRLDAPGAPQSIAADPAAFADPARLVQLSGAASQTGWQRWQTHIRQLREDPQLRVHYTMTDRGVWDRVLTNRAAGGGPLDGAIVGCSWVEGRWSGKYALEFKRTSDRVRLNLPGEFQSLSFAAWVRFDGLDRTFNSLMLTDEWKPGNPHWQISQEGEMILGVGGAGNYTSPRVLGPADLGRWIHLATVYDAAAGKVVHYVDGRAVHIGEIRVPQTLRIGTAELGNWGLPIGSSRQTIRNLNGRIDEFALFSRPMTAAQIADIYQAGRPH